MKTVSIETIYSLFKWTAPVCWADYCRQRTAPHDQSGFYVFTTYPDELRSNFREHELVPRPVFEGFVDESMSGKTVLYVGRAQRLNARISAYADAQDKCSQSLVELLNQYPESIWVRWTTVDDWEVGLIRKYRPSFNREGTGKRALRIDLNSIRLNWLPAVSWPTYADNPLAMAGSLSGQPGYYVFTDYSGTLRSNTKQPNGTVWYVGRSKDLHARMSNYLHSNNSGQRCNQSMYDLLHSPQRDQVWVRWVVHFDHEEELIASLGPAINKDHNPIGVEWFSGD